MTIFISMPGLTVNFPYYYAVRRVERLIPEIFFTSIAAFLRERLSYPKNRGGSLTGRTPVFWDGRTDDGRTLPSGVYFYRLTTLAGRTTKKMVLSR